MPEDTEDSLSPETKAEHEHKEGRSLDELAAKEQRIEELTDTLKRTQAEFENYKKRIERDWSERTRLAAERVIADLLPILDTFDKAEEVASKDVDAGAHAEGIRNIRKQLWQMLQRNGLKEVDTGVPFDPFLHEVLMREQCEDKDDGTILEVFQKGYMIGTKVIRTAKVRISTRPEEEPEAPEDPASGQDHDQHEADEEQEE